MADQPEVRGPILTVGHGSHAADRLLELLRSAGVERVVDVRSAPYSRHNPQHDLPTMRGWLAAGGIDLRHLGRPLGGRPRDPAMYDEDGHVRYDLLSRTRVYTAGLATLEGLAREQPTAILCAEEDPAGCHRHLLVGRTLSARGWRIRHLRGDGTVEDDAGTSDPQLMLFPRWRSARPVGGRPQPTAR